MRWCLRWRAMETFRRKRKAHRPADVQEGKVGKSSKRQAHPQGSGAQGVKVQVKHVRLGVEVACILGLLALAALCMPFMLAWLTYQWSKTRKCGN